MCIHTGADFQPLSREPLHLVMLTVAHLMPHRMLVFSEYAAADQHQHPTFDKMYACFVQYIGRQRSRGNASASEGILNLEQCRKDYDTMELKASSRLVRKSTKTIIDSGLQEYTKDLLEEVTGGSEIGSTNVASNIGVHFAGGHSEAPPHPQNHHANEMYGRDDFDNLLFSPKKNGYEEIGHLKQIHWKRKPFDEKAKASFRKRYENTGRKWELSSGKIVEDAIFEIGMKTKFVNPIHSFMIDCDDHWLQEHFTSQEWAEICAEWPEVSVSVELSTYIESFGDVQTISQLEKLLSVRPEGLEERLVYQCLLDWCNIYADDPSPFLMVASLSESYWQNGAWGITRQLAMGCRNCKMLPGDVAGLESKERKNRVQINKGLGHLRASVGVKGDLFWRSFDEPKRDWAVAEAAKEWNIQKDKYMIESSRKLPRQLHDILIHRTRELGDIEKLRTAAVPGLVLGGPVIQPLNLCWGRGGVNITRFRRGEATRLQSSVEFLGLSLSAIYTLIAFRATVMHFMEIYRSELMKIQKTARLRRARLPSEPEQVEVEELPLDLLCSSP
ncbi:hypothetical protein BGZ83_002010 [Gryganskiella cystojenkinii]|nr:hypothetical protein BGZ83_002010 [Gryganskiella cystojenkinii]